ncbi:hypothetical protein NPIL_309891 [Nephila pilipes]|uniref:Uncharacterized protein n=1 Tax=Nephila pilipes TaxID=299642 RepID=A0A8X6UDW0_NEPPI|nr:hypothetical protein NPIL_309891 [Nephila pilipes]
MDRIMMKEADEMANAKIYNSQIVSVKGGSLKTVHGGPHISFTLGSVAQKSKTASHGGVSSSHHGGSFNTHKTINHTSSFESRKGSGIGFYGLDSPKTGISDNSRPNPAISSSSANKPGGSTFSSSSFGKDAFPDDDKTARGPSSFDSSKDLGFGYYGFDSPRTGVSDDSRPKPAVFSPSANKPRGSTFSSSSLGKDASSEDDSSEFDFPKLDRRIDSAGKPIVSTFSDDKPAVSVHSSDKSRSSSLSSSSFDEDTSSEDDFSEIEFKNLDTDSDSRRSASSFSNDKPSVSTRFDKERYSKSEVNEFPKSDVLNNAAHRPETVSSYSSGTQAFTSRDKSQSNRFQNVPDFKGPQISFKMGSVTTVSGRDAPHFSRKTFSGPSYHGYSSSGQVKTQFLGVRPSVVYTEEPSYISGSPTFSLRNKIFYLTDDTGASAYDYTGPSLLYHGAEGAWMLDAAIESDDYVLVKKK